MKVGDTVYWNGIECVVYEGCGVQRDLDHANAVHIESGDQRLNEWPAKNRPIHGRMLASRCVSRAEIVTDTFKGFAEAVRGAGSR